ncbi:MAG: hypothetical protein J0I50_04395, partial [Microbacterium sp.]|nr:hypothetical protein [Microbacterium sp.]
MTKCGHVYCYACILQYLDMGDHPGWRKCPMCNESVDRRHLKSVLIELRPTIKVGDTCNFTLVQRPRDSIVSFR